jgi:hypothetical protein
MGSRKCEILLQRMQQSNEWARPLRFTAGCSGTGTIHATKEDYYNFGCSLMCGRAPSASLRGARAQEQSMQQKKTTTTLVVVSCVGANGLEPSSSRTYPLVDGSQRIFIERICAA